MAAVIAVDVPVRVCDVGGWTDTWFAGHGIVCSLAAGPGVSVRARSRPGEGQVTLDLADYAVRFAARSAPVEHALLAAAVAEAGAIEAIDVELHIASAVPPGSSLGTSSAICVGIIAALDALRGANRPVDELAAAAHRAEAGRLGRQAGVQDQVAAAHGGASLIAVIDYPRGRAPSDHRRAGHLAGARPAAPPRRLRRTPRLLGGPRRGDRRARGRGVIAAPPRGPAGPRHRGRSALVAGDLPRYGRALTAATEGQAALHPTLVSDDAWELIDRARHQQSLGWKVNGAGGAGGSLSILCRDPAVRDRLRDEAARLGHQPLALRLSAEGTTVVEL